METVSAAGWAATIAVLLALFAWDAVAARRPHTVRPREAAVYSIAYVAVSLLFGLVLCLAVGWGFGGQFFAGYLVEKSLSVDNLFVFLIIISSFAVPAELQSRTLNLGIAAALLLRIVFIALGAALIQLFTVAFLLFGVLLVATAIQLYRHRDEDPHVEDNRVVGVARRMLPLSDRYDGPRLVTRVDGRRLFTPMLLVLIALGSTDLMFALDSIPAVFGITQHTFIVFAANAFALLGMRPLYFLVSSLLVKLVYLSTGLASILLFIGIKLILHFAHTQDASVPEVSTALSLAVVCAILVVTVIASILETRRDPSAQAHAGAVAPRRERRAGEERVSAQRD